MLAYLTIPFGEAHVKPHCVFMGVAGKRSSGSSSKWSCGTGTGTCSTRLHLCDENGLTQSTILSAATSDRSKRCCLHRRVEEGQQQCARWFGSEDRCTFCTPLISPPPERKSDPKVMLLQEEHAVC